MTTFRNTVTIARPTEEVFAFLADFIQGQIGPFNASRSYLLEPTVGGTRLTNDVELEPASSLLRPFGPLAIPRVKAAVAHNLSTQARHGPLALIMLPSGVAATSDSRTRTRSCRS